MRGGKRNLLRNRRGADRTAGMPLEGGNNPERLNTEGAPQELMLQPAAKLPPFCRLALLASCPLPTLSSCGKTAAILQAVPEKNGRQLLAKPPPLKRASG
ncbi:MAG: hypothetical protein IKM62_00035 [Kiritimatiellae bacterium]|nr:hypothetical protein [Kiritimatiellia bacterium]